MEKISKYSLSESWNLASDDTQAWRRQRG